MLDILKSLISPAWSAVTGMRRATVKVHLAEYVESGLEAYFINVVNLSERRDIEITHVWFDTSPQIPVFQKERPLPKRLKPDEVWETWIEASRLPPHVKDAYGGFRVRLSTGKVLGRRATKMFPRPAWFPENHNKK